MEAVRPTTVGAPRTVEAAACPSNTHASVTTAVAELKPGLAGARDLLQASELASYGSASSFLISTSVLWISF